jgi:hypothetical protein
MTATIELNDRLIKQAEKLSGIDDANAIMQIALQRYVKGEKLARSLTGFKDADSIWQDYDPKGTD